jgi:hypothetical protein
MIEWLKAGLAEKQSTIAGALALLACMALIAVSLLRPDAYDQFERAIKTAEGLLFAGGVAGLLWRKASA